MQERDYLDILTQSLTKKLAVLEEIRKKNEEQRVLLLDEDLGPEEFEKNIESKGKGKREKGKREKGKRERERKRKERKGRGKENAAAMRLCGRCAALWLP